MHPQIEQDHPGNCPICGMTLEPKGGVALAEESTELRDMTRRFWVGAILSAPVLVLAMGHVVPSAPHWVEGDVSRWIQFVLSTPVVLWAGWPFFKRGWQSIMNRSLNMFTLIAIGIGTAYFYSVVVMLFPQLFPPSVATHGKIGIYFEAAAIITVLVLLGQVLNCGPAVKREAQFARCSISLRIPRASFAMAKNATCRSTRSKKATTCAFDQARKFPSTDESSTAARTLTNR